MKKHIILILVVFIILVPLSLANTNWFQEANAGINLPGGNGYIGYSSNLNNLATELDYTTCSIGGSIFTPVATDINNDSNPDIIITNSARIQIFSLDCELIAELTASGARAMPVIVNVDGDEFQEIVVLDGSTLVGYEYDYNTESFSAAWTIDYNSQLGITNIDYITCARIPNTCVGFKHSLGNSYYFDLDAQTVTQRSSEYPYTYIGTSAYDTRQGHAMVRTTGDNAYIMPFCGRGSTDVEFRCAFFNDTGHYTGIVSGNLVAASGNIVSISYNSAWAAKMGSLWRVFVTAKVEKTSSQYSTFVLDTSASTLLQIYETSYPTLENTNWMVGDYNKDGISEACTIINNTAAADDVSLVCYDNQFVSPITEYNISGYVNASRSFVMADFDPDFENLCFANLENIFCVNSTGVYILYNHSYVYDSSTRVGSGIVVSIGSSGSPSYVYTDSNIGFITQNAQISALCGNGVCDSFESSFSCPVDCGVITGAECITSADCTTAFPYCIGNLCVASDNISYTCTFDSDCPYDNPYCYEGICIKGWQSGLPTIGNITPEQAAVDASIDDTIGILFGTSSLLKFLVSIGLIIGTIVLVSQHSKNAMVGLIGGVLMMIFCTVVGLMPIYVLVLMVIVALSIVFLKTFFFGSAAGGNG